MNDIIKLTYQREGERVKTMEFDCIGLHKENGEVKDDYIINFPNHYHNNFRILDYENHQDITESLNPLYLEFITQEDCPECKKNKRSGIDIGMSDKEFGNRRRNSGLSVMKNHFCTDGRVKLSTGFYSFIGKDEYDRSVRHREMTVKEIQAELD